MKQEPFIPECKTESNSSPVHSQSDTTNIKTEPRTLSDQDQLKKEPISIKTEANSSSYAQLNLKKEPKTVKTECSSYSVEYAATTSKQALTLAEKIPVDLMDIDEDSEASDDENFRCPICLSSFKDQNWAKPDVCEHKFCLECIEEWSSKTNTCPIDRKLYRFIIATILDKENCSQNIERIRVEDRSQQNAENDTDEITLCEICQRSDREDRMLLCDGCDNGYHCECLTPAIDEIPEGQWFCPDCQPVREAGRMRIRRVRRSEVSGEIVRATAVTVSTAQRRHANFVRPVARTRFMERIRHSVNNNRIQRGGFIIETEDEESSNSDEDESDPVSEASESDRSGQCSCIMCDETCQVRSVSSARPKPIQRKRAKKKVTKRRSKKAVKRAGKTTRKTKSKVRRTRRRRKVFKRNSGEPVMTQAKILSAIRAAKQQQIESAKSSSASNVITMTSIELEFLKNKISGGKESRGPRFPAKMASAWYEDSVMDEIDECSGTNTSGPMCSKSLEAALGSTGSSRPSGSTSVRPTTSKHAVKSVEKTTAPASFLDSLISNQSLLLAHSSKVEVKRDGSIRLASSTSVKSNSGKNSFDSTKTTMTSESTTPSANLKQPETTDSGSAYDPFNPDDSLDEQTEPKVIKFEIKSTSVKLASTALVDSTFETKEPVVSGSDVKSEAVEPADVAVVNKTEPALEEVKTECVEASLKANGQSSSKKDSKKEHKSSGDKNGPESKIKRPLSPSRPSRERRVTRSRSPKSPRRDRDRERDKDSSKSVSRTSRRSRSSSKTRRNSRGRKGSRDRTSERTGSHKSSQKTQQSKRSRSSSRSHKSSKKTSRSPSATSSKPVQSHRTTSSNSRDRYSKSTKPVVDSNLKRTPPPTDLKQNSEKKPLNKASSERPKDQKYSDYLIEEMISEEKQQIIDINKISLPVNEASRSSNGEGKTSLLKIIDQASSSLGNKTNLDMRLDLIFGNSGEKSETRSDQTETRKENFNQLEKDLAKLTSSVKKEESRGGEGSKRQQALVKEEAYDPEIEYQEASARILNEAKLNDQNLKSKGVVAGKLIKSTESKDKKKHSKSPEKKPKVILDNQEKIVSAAKHAIKPHYVSKKISKDDYKVIMKKVVTKCLYQNKTGLLVDVHKVNKMVIEYINRNGQSSNDKNPSAKV